MYQTVTYMKDGEIAYQCIKKGYEGFTCVHTFPGTNKRVPFKGLCVPCANWIEGNILCTIVDKPLYREGKRISLSQYMEEQRLAH